MLNAEQREPLNERRADTQTEEETRIRKYAEIPQAQILLSTVFVSVTALKSYKLTGMSSRRMKAALHHLDQSDTEI